MVKLYSRINFFSKTSSKFSSASILKRVKELSKQDEHEEVKVEDEQKEVFKTVNEGKSPEHLKNLNEIPGPSSFPFIGTSWQFFPMIGRYKRPKLHEANADKFKRFGSIVSDKISGHLLIHLYHPRDFEEVFRNQGPIPIRPPSSFITHYRRQNPARYPSVGLAHSQGEEWACERKLLAPILLQTAASNIPNLNAICDDFIAQLQGSEKLKNGGRFEIPDIREVTYKLALESVCAMCLDTRIGMFGGSDLKNEQQNSQSDLDIISSTKNLFESYNELYYSNFCTWKYFNGNLSRSYRKFKKSEDEIYELASELIDAKWQEIETRKYESTSFGEEESSNSQGNRSVLSSSQVSPNKPNPISSATISEEGGKGKNDMSSNMRKKIVVTQDVFVSVEEEDKLDDEEEKRKSLLEVLLDEKQIELSRAKAMVVDLIAGGIFTVSNSLSFLLFHLARNKQVQEKLYHEIQHVLESSDGKITKEEIAGLSYLKACIKESFRLTPTVPAVVRVLPQDMQLSGYKVPKGTTIFSHFLVTCQMEEYFEDPQSFKPERWLHSNPKRSQMSKFASLPFGFGLRMCPGKRFSELELLMVTAKLLFKFELDTNTKELDMRQDFLVVPSHEIHINLTPR